MFGFAKAIGQHIGRKIGEEAAERVLQDIRDGKFDPLIADIIVKTVREGRDDGLSETGFMLKIMVELIDKSVPPLPYQRARSMAEQVYLQFRRDNGGVKFGDPAWDWSGHGARELAQEYEIAHWEPVP